ncbi:interleukin-6 receptor subunit beta-like isoform X2 [Narcine bancroftii]|uniref:interleukin-6 receptor subunit beta-like isoform X2 n=1 Tax=Narcine bancroftii TaxID=1343680 RepID=UPI0038320C86
MFTTEKTVFAWAWVIFAISSFIIEGGLPLLCHDVDYTSKVVKLRSSLSLACALRRECIESIDANASHIYWKLNDTKIPQEQYHFNDTVSRVALNHFDAVKGYLTCHINIKGAPNVLHRFTIKAGLPPEKPTNISCVTYWEKNFTCFWDQGHETYIETNFTLIRIIKSLPNASCVSLKKNTCSFIFPDIYIVKRQKIIVMAENALGKVWSDPLDLDTYQTFTTGPPQNVRVHSIQGQGRSLLVTWRNPIELAPDIQLVYNIQYQMVGASKWIQATEKEEIINHSFVITNLKPFTNYTVAVRCIGKHQINWSDWSSKGTGLTSEAKPLAAPKLWRQIKNPDSQGIREVHLQWKALNKSKTNGIILGYRIWSENQCDQTLTQQDNTTSLNYSLLLTREAHVLTVVAYNSVGDSPKATLIIPAINQTGPTSILYVKVTSQNHQLLAQWKTLKQPDNGYIIEWCLFLDTNPCAEPLHWQYEESMTEMAYLHGDFLPFVCYNISVYAMSGNIPGNPCSKLAYLQQSYPTEGPSVVTHETKGTEAIIKWQAIPVEKRRGFITNYTIFYTSAKDENAVTLKPNVFEYTLKSLQKNTEYSVYVMASTVKGGTNSSLIFRTNAIGSEDIVMIVAAIILCFLLLITVFIACFKNQHRVKKHIWPEVADPAGSSMADWLQKHHSKNVHDLRILYPSNNFTPDFSPVEVLCLPLEDNWNDKTSSLQTAEGECSSTLSPQQQNVTNGAEMAGLLQPTDMDAYTVLEESYRSQVPDNRLSEEPLPSSSLETSAGDQVIGQNICDEEENGWELNINEDDLLQQIIKVSSYLKSSLNARELRDAPSPDGTINSGYGNCSQEDMAKPKDTGTLDQNQYNNHPDKPMQTYITLELLGLRLNKRM